VTLRIDEGDRYDRLRLLADCDPERLRRARVLLAGVGALGNEVAKTCALLGVGTVVCVDRDTVAVSNLTRSVLFRAADAGAPKAAVAARRLRELNPDVAATALVADLDGGLGLGTLADCDLAFGCVDSREARVALNAACYHVGVPLVDGALGDLSGTVRTFVPPDGPCYECGLTRTDWQLLAARQPCGLLGQAAVAEGRTPTTPMAAAVVGAMQVQAALRLLRGDRSHAGTAEVWNGRGPTAYATRLPARPDCTAHDPWPAPVALPVGARDPVAALLAAAAPRLGGAATLRLAREWVASAQCVDCGREEPVRRPWVAAHRQGRAAACGACGGLRTPTTVDRVDAASPHAAEPLAALGIAPDDVVRLDGAGGAVLFARLAADRLAGFAGPATPALPSGSDGAAPGPALGSPR
jgi:adenylyltransferase/sulfurtransferase